MSSIPLVFDPYDWEEHLEFSETAGVVEARWKATGLSIFYPPPKAPYRTPEREQIARATPQLRFHGHNGYSLGRYTELFIYPSMDGLLSYDDLPARFFFKMGSIEASFGQPTPLAHFLFYRGHNEDVSGPFWSFYSIRLMGVTHENAEIVGLNAMLLLEKEHKIPLRPARLGDFVWDDVDDDNDVVTQTEDRDVELQLENYLGDDPVEVEPQQLVIPTGFTEVDPLRLLFSGRVEPTAEVAVLQLYRVLEYFSILCIEETVATMRADNSLSTRKFLLEVQALVAKDEKGLLGRLLSKIADGQVLAMAKEAKLIDKSTTAALTEALYEFRNSVVHAKEDRGARVFTASIFNEPSDTAAWRRVCDSLAWKAIERFGTRAE